MKTLEYFAQEPFITALRTFFDDLHIPLHHIAGEPLTAVDVLQAKYKPNDPAHALIDEIYALGALDDAAFERGSTPAELEAVREKKTDYDGLLIFGVTLKPRAKGLLPTRSQMAEIARAFNRAFHYTPIVIVFRYAGYIAFANCERSAYQQSWREGEKAGKVSLLRDIDVCKTHAGHMRILQQLQINPLQINSFQKLYNYWQGVLSVSTLNKEFYAALSNWFFAAQKYAKFPDKGDHAVERGLIRLITRLIFTWFIKERGLVPDTLFEPEYIATLLKDSKPESDTYYRAVLQNLFFATLNSEMNERRFCKEDGGAYKQKGDYALNCFRYAEEFNDQNAWLELVKDVPFLNGGLFECLDHCTKEGEYIDGFSRNPKQQARLRNDLFWGEQWEADLSGVYDDKRKAKVLVTPLLDLLHSYKFTVDENTPLEEDVALDPELLGKVFENLLASYNPETRTTARKQTGSFYTPREIVHYMVEEALYAYLTNHVGVGVTTGGDPNGGAMTGTVRTNHASHGVATAEYDVLRVLLSDTDARTATQLGFSETQIRALVAAIQRCTILDPACGSGAFPMGALAKMVALLKKLDPENNLWRAAQLNAVAQRLQQESSSSEAKAQAQAETQKIFEDNAPDYARKLFLIEKCLFGSDIQPVALQITKLRFFIALIIDQNIDRAKDNWGIRALPNLETKFVAANTLISLPQRGSTLFDTTELQAHKAQLFDKRRRHIAPKNRREKKQLEEDDKKLRALIKDELLDLRFDEDGARLIAEYNPYDQNATAPFFDPEWMFGPDVKDGFDIVIGNPPYVRADGQDPKVRSEIMAQKRYETLWEKWDLYIPFIELGYKVLRPGGVTTLIVADAFCHAKYAIKPQKWYLENAVVRRLDFLRDIKVFEASVSNIVYFFQKPANNVKPADNVPERRLHVESFGQAMPLPTKTQKDFDHRLFFPEELSAKQERVFGDNTIQLGAICYLSVGMVVHAHEALAQGAFELKDVISPVKDKKHPKPFVEGKQLSRWHIPNCKWLEWGTERAPAMFRRPTFPELYDHPEKILILRIAGKTIRACYDDKGLICNHTSIVCVPWNMLRGVRNGSIKKSARYRNEKPPRPDLPSREDLEETAEKFQVKYLLAVMLSETAQDFLQGIRRSNTDIYPDDWKKLPIPTATPTEQAAIASKVEQVLAAKAHDPAADVSTLEREIDELVAALYGLDEAEKQLVGLGPRADEPRQ